MKNLLVTASLAVVLTIGIAFESLAVSLTTTAHHRVKQTTYSDGVRTGVKCPALEDHDCTVTTTINDDTGVITTAISSNDPGDVTILRPGTYSGNTSEEINAQVMADLLGPGIDID